MSREKPIKRLNSCTKCTEKERLPTRQRLRPWLEAVINSGFVPGLVWLDDDQTKFRVPWVHSGKQDWTPDSSQIFMEWAKNTGRYREGIDKPNYVKWKTRLRCAFNKATDMEEIISERSVIDSCPYRVYHLKPVQARRTSTSRTLKNVNLTVVKPKYEVSAESVVESPVCNRILPTILDEFAIGEDSSLCGIESQQTNDSNKNLVSTLSFDFFASQLSCTQVSHRDDTDDLHCDPCENPAVNHDVDKSELSASTIDNAIATFLGALNPSPSSAVFPGKLLSPSSATDIKRHTLADFHLTVLESQVCAGSSIGSDFTEFPFQLANDSLVYTCSSVEPPAYGLVANDNEIEVQVLYSGSLIHRIVTRSACHIQYGEYPIDVDEKTPDFVRQLSMDETAHQLQRYSLPQGDFFEGTRTQLIKEGLPNGIVIWCDALLDVYAYRLCRCAIFLVSDLMTNGQPVKIPLRSGKSTKIFSYSDRFIPELDNYVSSGGAKRPSVDIHLLCGQELDSVSIDNSVLIRFTVNVTYAVNGLKIADNLVANVKENALMTSVSKSGLQEL